MTNLTTGFYVLGGTVPRDARSYVVRRADGELLDALRRGQFCYVLTSRQMGKSSLMVRTVTRLRQERVTCMVLDMTSIGQNLSEEQWYDGLLNRVATQLDLETELDDFWISHPRLGPLQRWVEALHAVVLKHVHGRIVLFIDEIDAVRSLPFSTDEFFAAIRQCYNRRTEDSEFERLTFCLLGVATPADLIRDTRSTPFNIGTRIELSDFTTAEAAPLMEGLGVGGAGVRCSVFGVRDPEQAAKALLSRILYWTNGHPYLTQRLCAAVAERAFNPIPEHLNTQTLNTPIACVDAVCEELFLSPAARNRDDNLLFVRERLLRSEVDRAGLLEAYAQVRAGRRVKDDETNSLLSVLRLSGIVRAEGVYLRVRNRIYAQIFDQEWIRANMPDAEMRRQKMAYRRGFIRAAALAGVVVTLFGGLAWFAFQESRRANANAMRANLAANSSRQQAYIAQRYLYAADMGLAQQAWNEGNYGRVRELLDEFRPAANQPDLRGFEWWLLWWRGHYDLPFLRDDTDYIITSVGFSRDGRTLCTSNREENRYWDAVTGRKAPQPAGQAFEMHTADTSSVHHVLVSPDGRFRAEGTHYFAEQPEFKHSSVRLEDARTGRLLHILPGAMAQFAFSPDSRTLATESPEEGVLLWKTATGVRGGQLKGVEGPLAFSPDGARLAAGSYAYGNGIKLLDMTTSREPQSLPGTADVVALAARANLLATVDADWKGVTIREESTRRVLRRLPGITEPMTFSQDSSILAATVVTNFNRDLTRIIGLWDCATGRAIGRITANQTGYMSGVALSPNGSLLATNAQDGASIWEVATGRRIRLFPHATGTPAFSADGRRLAVPEADRRAGGRSIDGSTQRVTLYDMATGHELYALPGAHAPIAFSPITMTGDLTLLDLVTGWNGNTLKRWKLWEMGKSMSHGNGGHKIFSDDSEPEIIYRGHRYGIQTCVFSPDGQRLAAGDSGEYNVILWDATTGRETFHISGHTDRTDVASYTLAFSPDGLRLYSGNQDGVIKVW
jgi:WD40 repeat protein